MEKIRILYIDDSPESGLERYLDKEYVNANYEIEYDEITFNPDNGYESLVHDPLVQSANIIFIDSRLFENRSVSAGKFSGEEFKIILKKYFPFIEVVVITQNEIDLLLGTIPKFNPNCGKSSTEYYAGYLPAIIEKAIQNILIYRRLADRLKINDNWETILKEKIVNSLNGVGTYDELSKSDIDSLIISFKEIQEIIDAE